MANRYSMQITIGGTLPVSRIDDFYEAVTVSSVRSIFGEGPPAEQLERLDAWLMTQVPPAVPPLLLHEQ